MTTTISASLRQATDRLRTIAEEPSLDAGLLLAFSTGHTRTWLAAHPENPLSPPAAAKLEDALARLEHGETLPYILGEWQFFGLPFLVSPVVLIPRPETELLVEKAIAWLKERAASKQSLSVLDVGTGSGCIAISLAVHLPTLQVSAVDISSAALEMAQQNADRLGVADRLHFILADLYPEAPSEQPSPTLAPYDLIVSNLPYIPTQTLHGLAVYSHEPALALDGGPDGLSLIRRLLARLPQLLAPGGLVLMEIEASLGPPVLSLAVDSFDQAEIHLHRDLSGHDRLLEIQI